MTQQLQSGHLDGDGEFRGSRLPAILAGDVAAATLSATAISPIITAIDR
jgi:hypothetical protein